MHEGIMGTPPPVRNTQPNVYLWEDRQASKQICLEVIDPLNDVQKKYSSDVLDRCYPSQRKRSSGFLPFSHTQYYPGSFSV